MYNTDYTYCDGKGCLLCETCRRYIAGQRIKNSRTDGQYYWMDNCEAEKRPMYESCHEQK